MIKKEIRVLGISCGVPYPRRPIPIQVVGVVYRGNRWLEGVMRTTIPPDALDLTLRIAKMIVSSPHFPQLRVIALDELVTKHGRYIDIDALSKKTKLPVIAVLRQRGPILRLSKRSVKIPHRTLKAFAKLPCSRWRTATRSFAVYSAGLGEIDLEELLTICASEEGLPEASRVARITASSLERFLSERLT